MKVIEKHDKILELFCRSLFIIQLFIEAIKSHDKADLDTENER